MKQLRLILLCTLLSAVLLPAAIWSQTEGKTTPAKPEVRLVDSLGVVDTMFAEIGKVNENTWSVAFSYFCDEEVVGFSVPFTYKSKLNRLVADSAKFSDKVSGWDYKSFRVDTAIQTVTIGLIANITSAPKALLPGRQPLFTVYVSSLEGKPIEQLGIDTTTTHPGNILMAVADMIQGTPPDTVRLSPLATKIYPVWMVTEPKK